MNTTDLDALERDHLATWIDPDPARRREIVERIWAPDGRLSIAPAGRTLTGVDAIVAHTTRVHDERIAGQGMRFVYDQRIDGGDLLLLRWSMLAPDGSTAARGVDIARIEAGRFASVHMFMGVD
ncbi:nuclear transport factor 2 family protein [Pseudoclavibacter chungangensis]|uniref:Nuclear transport factor 2 family protein n=1 Tax=Pseudoclavibacter chungangensis TaxID=587635 RepID=A0A7J5C316_9MICO|nr:nuclear transport factor 2 family protein [Pseudoclavibacter chungangensis]KAB1662592.1 nuclear transport factor 2 family protein [Pseudoclavibacter chungangensis]NYJ68641.1 hypothetical protein [Pseudoclavibacter chungangensis]